MEKDMCLKYADYIIEKATISQKPLSNKQLQKILFYSYVDYARNEGKPMFADEFCAWSNGPVLPLVYSEYSKYQNGKMYISQCKEKVSKEKKPYLDRAFDLIIDKDIDEVIYKTHNSEDENNKTPWQKHYTTDPNKIVYTDEDVIPFGEINSYYSIKENYNYLTNFDE